MSKKYLYKVSILSKKNSNPLDAIAHYSGQEQYDVINNKCYVSNTKEQVFWSNIIVPDKTENPELFFNLPDYLRFRSQKSDLISNSRNILWKNIDSRETRLDSQFSRLFELSLPYFLNHNEAVELISKFSKELVLEGMIIDCSLHSYNKKNGNNSIFEKFKTSNNENQTIDTEEISLDYTGYLMCTLRDYKNGQFINKNRDWNLKEKMHAWRNIWTNLLQESIIKSSDVTEEDKKIWNKKLSFYPNFSSNLDFNSELFKKPSFALGM